MAWSGSAEIGPTTTAGSSIPCSLFQKSEDWEDGENEFRGTAAPSASRAWGIGINETENSPKRLRQPKFHVNFGRISGRLKFRPAFTRRWNSLRRCRTRS